MQKVFYVLSPRTANVKDRNRFLCRSAFCGIKWTKRLDAPQIITRQTRKSAATARHVYETFAGPLRARKVTITTEIE